MQFLGTGAAEIIPNPYCECDVCRFARKSSDPKEKRARSSFLIDSKNLIDCGPDTAFAASRYGVSLSGLKNIFVTHMHRDHFDFTDLEPARMSATEKLTLNMYMSEAAKRGFEMMLEKTAEIAPLDAGKNLPIYKEHLIIHEMQPYQTVCTEEGMNVSALYTIHEAFYENEKALNYLFERNGKRLLYACDTGRYVEENFDFLRGKKLDYIVMEGTFGNKEVPDDFKHLNAANFLWMIQRFQENGNLDDNTRIYVSHVAHKGMLTHYAYEKQMKAADERISIAYDGLEIGEL